MRYKLRQRTGMADSACVAMLCMVTTMLLGFTKPELLQASDSTAKPVEIVVQSLAVTEIRRPQPAVMPNVARSLEPVTLSRPISFTDKAYFQSVLGGIYSHLWLPRITGPDDEAEPFRDELQARQFRGVGYPDIRSRGMKSRSPFDPPGPWAPLVAWRTLQGDASGVPEAIAHVRCMGLSPQAVARRADRYRGSIECGHCDRQHVPTLVQLTYAYR